ncbi:hypothetical protein J2S23_001011, partial [Streptococcus moroccensis]|nr:hypothetical protein [Streptococcus moroccensis]
GHVHLLSILSWGILVYQTNMSFLLHFILQRGVFYLAISSGVLEMLKFQQALSLDLSVFLIYMYLFDNIYIN